MSKTLPSEGIIEREVGPHTIRFEPPDVCFTTLVGDVSDEQIAALLAVVEALFRGRPEAHAIADISRMGPASEGAKRLLRGLQLSSRLVLIGASFQLKMTTRLLDRASSLLGRVGVPAPVTFHFVDTPAEARKLVQSWRRASRPELVVEIKNR